MPLWLLLLVTAMFVIGLYLFVSEEPGNPRAWRHGVHLDLPTFIGVVLMLTAVGTYLYNALGTPNSLVVGSGTPFLKRGDCEWILSIPASKVGFKKPQLDKLVNALKTQYGVNVISFEPENVEIRIRCGWYKSAYRFYKVERDVTGVAKIAPPAKRATAAPGAPAAAPVAPIENELTAKAHAYTTPKAIDELLGWEGEPSSISLATKSAELTLQELFEGVLSSTQ